MSDIWDRFTLEEEYDSRFRDQFGRSRLYSSSNPDIFSPNVSEFLFDRGFEPKYPDDKPFAACLSHDIDYLPFTKLSRLKDFFHSGRGGMKKHFLHLLSYNYDHRLDIEFIVEMEQKLGATSSFYFLSLEREDLDFSYRVNSLREEFAYLKEEEFEIGLHGGHTAYNDSGRIAIEKERLETASGTAVNGYRGHFLRFLTPTTWEILVENQLVYDTTLSYPDSAGFRNGMCYPFRPFSLRTQSFMDVFEVPLIVMDAALFGYMKLSIDTAFELCVDMIERVERVNGVFTILWHNSYMKGEPLKLYTRLLEVLMRKNAWLTSTANLIDYWSGTDYDRQIEELVLSEKPA